MCLLERTKTMMMLLVWSSVAAVVHEYSDVRLSSGAWIKVYTEAERDDLPLLLYINGGLGTPSLSVLGDISHHYAKNFVLVAPEQRGVLGINATQPSASLEEHIGDLGEILTMYRRRFTRSSEVYLWSLSFGAVMAFRLAERHAVDGIVATGPVVLHADLNETSKKAVKEVCDTFYSRMPWYLFPLRAIGCPTPDWGYWRTFFYYMQLMGPLCLTVKCDTPPMWNMKAPSIRSMLASPFHGMSEVLRLGWSNANAKIMQNLMTEDAMWDPQPVSAPVAIMASRHDPLVPADAVGWMLRTLPAPKVTVHWFEHSGHFTPIEEPAAHAQALLGAVTSFRECAPS